MTERKRHWFKWYPADWRGEPALRMVSRGARSVWVDMLGLMHDSTLIGYLLLNGKKPTPEQLARVLGDDIRDLSGWLDELAAAGVYSETEDGVIFSRRMVRDNERAEKGRADVNLRWGAKAKQPQNTDRSANTDPNRVPTADPSTYMLPSKYQSLSKNLVGPEGEKPPEPTGRVGQTEGFEEFWKAYPRNPNMSKSEALKSWVKLRQGGVLPLAERMMVAVAGYRKYLNDQSKGRPNPYPAAHAATWLNQQRFAGFLEAPATPVGAPMVDTGPGWEAEHPETWGQLRAGLFEMHKTDAVWQTMFAGCRPNGSPFTLICPTRFDRDTLETKYAERLEKLFKHPVKFEFSPPQPKELRH